MSVSGVSVILIRVEFLSECVVFQFEDGVFPRVDLEHSVVAAAPFVPALHVAFVPVMQQVQRARHLLRGELLQKLRRRMPSGRVNQVDCRSWLFHGFVVSLFGGEMRIAVSG